MADDRDLPDEYLIEIGRMVHRWTALDQMLNLMIQKLAGFNDLTDFRSLVLTVHSSFPQRMDILKSFCEHFKDEYPHLANYKHAVSQINEVARLRNRYMHSVMGYDPDKKIAKISNLSARGKLKGTLESFSLNDLRETNQKIIDAGQSLYTLVLNANPWSYPST